MENNTNAATASGDDVIKRLESIDAGDFEPGPEDVLGPEKEKEPEIPTSQVLVMVIGPLFDILAPAWEVSDEEKQSLAGAYAPVVDKYFPGMDAGPEIVAIAITAMVIAPRMGKPRKIVEKEKEGGEGGSQSEHQPSK
jgi:hypothetical protein